MRTIILSGLIMSAAVMTAPAYADLTVAQGSPSESAAEYRDTNIAPAASARALSFAAPAPIMTGTLPPSLAPHIAPVAANPILIAKLEVSPTPVMQSASPWGKILSTYGAADGDLNRFDYGGLSGNAADMESLDGYIQKLAGKAPSRMDKNEALAYWANLYNALTVQVVAKNWPVKSIKEIKSGVFKPGPWNLELVTVEGRSMSLNDIEHGTMRATWDEPRIHYMVNCASIGCPNLMLSPWKAETLEADLDAAAKAFVNSPRGAKVSDGNLTISSIFKWYKKDFGGNDAGIIAHLKQYASGDLKSALDGVSKISKDQYDWNVNAK